MRLNNYTKEMIDENSFIEMSHIYLEDKKDDVSEKNNEQNQGR
mgnify:CR=1 FL=1